MAKRPNQQVASQASITSRLDRLEKAVKLIQNRTEELVVATNALVALMGTSTVEAKIRDIRIEQERNQLNTAIAAGAIETAATITDRSLLVLSVVDERGENDEIIVEYQRLVPELKAELLDKTLGYTVKHKNATFTVIGIYVACLPRQNTQETLPFPDETPTKQGTSDEASKQEIQAESSK